MWKLLLSYPSGQTSWLRRHLIVKIGVEFIRFNWICVKIITFPSDFSHLSNFFPFFVFFERWRTFSRLMHKRSTTHPPSCSLHPAVVKWSDRDRERGKRQFCTLHPWLVRELTHWVLVNSFSLERLDCSGSSAWLKTNNKLYAITVVNIFSLTQC